MTRRVLRLNAWSVLLALFGCAAEPQQAIHPIHDEPAVHTDSGESQGASGGGPATANESTSSPPRGGSAAPSDPTPRGGSGGAPGGVSGSPSTDTTPQPGPEGEEDSDAGAAAPPATRTDGCPPEAPLSLNRVRILPAPGEAGRIAGARIQGSNSGPTTNFVNLASVVETLAEGAVVDLSFSNTERYRYLRYYAPQGSHGNVAELEFYHDAWRLSGDAFGTATTDERGSFAAAFDGDPATSSFLLADGGGYIGLDIARGFVTEPVTFTPSGTTTAAAVEVALSSATEGASIHYTVDGSDPAGATALSYTAPIRIDRGPTSIRAVAKTACRFDSAVRSESYSVSQLTNPVRTGLKSYHIGNSLTDTINPWLEPIADSTGVDHIYARWTIPGAPIGWLAEHQGEGFENPEGAASFDSFVQTFAPIDHLSLQPFSDPDFESQGGAAVGLLTTALRYSPDVQFWIYAQWPARTEWMRNAFSNGGGTVYPDWQVPTMPTTWEEAARNEVLYHEAFANYVDERVGGKPFLVVPGGLALVELKRQMDAGEIPGLGEFWATMFEDEIHLTPPAQYLIALVFYACLYRQTPEGRVTAEGAGLTPEQAVTFQRIAWNIASAYPRSGISP